MYIGHKSWHFLSILLFLQATRKKLKGFRYSYLVSVAKGTTKAAPQFPHTRSSINSRRFNIRWLGMYFYNVASATYPSDDYIFHFLLGLVAIKKKNQRNELGIQTDSPYTGYQGWRYWESERDWSDMATSLTKYPSAFFKHMSSIAPLTQYG